MRCRCGGEQAHVCPSCGSVPAGAKAEDRVHCLHGKARIDTVPAACAQCGEPLCFWHVDEGPVVCFPSCELPLTGAAA